MATAERAVPPAAATPAERLSRAAAALGGRLADLLDRVLPDRDDGGARDFLRALAADAPPAIHGDGDDPLDRFAGPLGLSAAERDLLLLAALPEEHEGYAGVLRSLHPRGEPRPTAGLAAQLLAPAPAARHRLRGVLASGAAVRAGALVVEEEGPFWERSLRLADALWPALGGADALPAALAAERGPVVAAGLDDWLAGEEAGHALAALRSGVPVTLLVTGGDPGAAHHRGAVLVRAAGLEPLRLRLPAAPDPALERLASVHALARGAVPVLRAADRDAPSAEADAPLPAHPGPVVLCGRPGELPAPAGRATLEVAAEPIRPSLRVRMWSDLLPDLPDAAPSLAARFAVEPHVAAGAAGDALARSAASGRARTEEDVARGVRTRAGAALPAGIRLLRPAAGWDDLVLAPDRMAQLREALDRLLHQARVLDEWGFLAGRPGARGVRMLFSGPSGTGKTLSAEVLAGALGVDLLLVDASRVVSKWIGETEKNLSGVFDAAERAQAVLFFDEADALFGKRTEVSDAHDRYANLETAYLLTRLERFEGLAVLSTNLRQNVDGAFLRRLEFLVEFEEPDAAERAALWRRHLPSAAPLADDLRPAELAALFPVVGGVIRNAATAAGFLAAAEGSPITRAHVVRALRREYDKLGRAFPGRSAGGAAP